MWVRNWRIQVVKNVVFVVAKLPHIKVSVLTIIKYLLCLSLWISREKKNHETYTQKIYAMLLYINTDFFIYIPPPRGRGGKNEKYISLQLTCSYYLILS